MRLITVTNFLLAAGLTAAAAQAAPPRDFMREAIQGDNSEMTLGALARSQGRSAGVRDFGRTLASDHRMAKQQAVPVARRLGMRPPTNMAPEARSEYARLRHMRGAAFDREFARYMVSDHRKDIAHFEEQARSGDRATARLARQQLPALRHHLEIAQSLAR